MNISIAMAVYNGEKYIEQQLDSILEDIDMDDEIIISYDESVDKTYEIVKEYEKNNTNIHVVINKEPGVFGNFNNAIVNSTKDYIFISDQDDIWIKGKKEKVLEAFKNNNADMVIHNGVSINEKNDIISSDFFSIQKIGNNVLRNYLKPRYSGCCTAFNKKMKNYIIPIPTTVGGYDHWIGMIGETKGKLIFINDVLIYHRLHGENVTPEKRRSIHKIVKYRVSLLWNLMNRRRKNE